jgi:hypothetical protein
MVAMMDCWKGHIKSVEHMYYISAEHIRYFVSHCWSIRLVTLVVKELLSLKYWKHDPLTFGKQ